MSSQQRVGQAAQHILVTLLAQLTVELFWSHVPEIRQTGFLFNMIVRNSRKNTLETKTGHDSLIIFCKEDGTRGQRAMQKSMLVGLIERLSDLPENDARLVKRKWLKRMVTQPLLQRSSLRIGADQRDPALLYQNLRDRENVRMHQLLEISYFLIHPLFCLWRSHHRSRPMLDEHRFPGSAIIAFIEKAMGSLFQQSFYDKCL